MPKISVIIPVYNVEKYLCRCVDSVLLQTFIDFELILIDDGSPDNCGSICDEYAQRDKRVFVIHTENKGVSSARNTGIEWALSNSDSQWITFIDSDDWVHPRYLEVLLEIAEKTNSSISASGYVKTVGEVDEISQEKFIPKVWRMDDFFVKRNVNAIVPWGKLYKKECFSSVRYPIGRRYEDEATTYKVLFKFENIAVVDAEMYYYYTNPESFMNSAWSPNRLESFEILSERFEYFEKMGNEKLCKYDTFNYVICLTEQLKKLKKEATNEYKQKYEPIMRKMLKKKIRFYKKHWNDFKFKGNEWIYEQAYPDLMRWYWIMNSVKNKILRKK